MADTTRAGSLGTYRKKRSFSKTPEPRGARGKRRTGPLRFVVQKHAATSLHFDLRLEMEGVMRSWAVPKGPSLDPGDRRLAMEVEDHPIEYADFEGTIPEDEYGGGTVMIWDRGTYAPDDAKTGEDPNAAALRGYRDGKLSVTFDGERLHGSFVLVRTDTVEGGARSKWLLIKHRDEDAEPGSDLVADATDSVTTGRTMDEIAAGKDGGRVWRSANRRQGAAKATRSRPRRTEFPSLRPMLATTASSPPERGDWVFEPKYDGIRVLAFVTADSVALVTRNGYDKSTQFPEVAAELRALAASLGSPVVLDGEIVPLEDGEVGRFEGLQGRMHLRDRSAIAKAASDAPAAFVAFDALLRGDDVFVHAPWRERRKRLESILEGRTSDSLRVSETSDDHRAFIARGEREGWEGIMAKRRSSRYRPGTRGTDWLKLKIENRQEFVVGGWTDPRRSRPYLGAILLGYHDDEGRLVYAGHTGTGFSGDSLAEMYRRLRPLERRTPPFTEEPKTNEKAHWTTPKVVVEVKFNEWTRDGKLRQPVFVGIRDDKDPGEVKREPLTRLRGAKSDGRGEKAAATAKPGRARRPRSGGDPVVRRLEEIARSGGKGELRIGRSASVPITNMSKRFFPKTGHTKGDLLTYYARMADLILPWMRDRPLVLKRFPDGVRGESFYQQAAPDEVPPGVRAETLRIDGKDQRRLVGGNLATLLYTIQLGAISYDPWHSRVNSLDSADYSVLDLDPGPGAGFRRVVEVAALVKEEMDEMGLTGAIKTSGSSGIHIYIPLTRRTPLDAATLVARVIATRVAEKHPRVATVERMTRKRPKGTVYVDFLQNILGKTVAGVYAVRAKPNATVSTPIAWDELTPDLDLREFTLDTVPDRVESRGDLWAAGMEKRNSLAKLFEPSA